MKKILLFSAALGMTYMTMSSYETGAGTHGYNRTGSKNTATTCGGSGCHGGTSANTSVSIEVDSAGVPVTGYVPGTTYAVKITGSNTSNLPKFGFQFSSVSGSGSAQVQAGTYSGTPSNTHTATVSGLSILEHSLPLSGNSGNYAITFNWTAPATGVGIVTMYATINAVNGNGDADAPDASNNTHIQLTEYPLGLATISANTEITAYPNPTKGQLNIMLHNAATGTYQINVYDMSGRTVARKQLDINNSSFELMLNTSNWPNGMYGVQIINNGAQRVIPVVKQ